MEGSDGPPHRSGTWVRSLVLLHVGFQPPAGTVLSQGSQRTGSEHLNSCAGTSATFFWPKQAPGPALVQEVDSICLHWYGSPGAITTMIHLKNQHPELFSKVLPPTLAPEWQCHLRCHQPASFGNFYSKPAGETTSGIRESREAFCPPSGHCHTLVTEGQAKGSRRDQSRG